jgi:hypothetical protein
MMMLLLMMLLFAVANIYIYIFGNFLLRRGRGTGPRAAVALLSDLVAREGPRGLFRGLSARLTAVVPVSAIMAEMYDWIKRTNLRVQ